MDSARSTASQLPPHRSFLSVELPFLLTPTAPQEEVPPSAPSLAKGQRAEVKAFLPARLLGECLLSHASAPSTWSVTGSGSAVDKDLEGGTRGEPLSVDSDDDKDEQEVNVSLQGRMTARGSAKRNSAPSSGAPSSRLHRKRSRSRDDGDETQNGRGVVPAAAAAAADKEKEQEGGVCRIGLDLADPQRYSTSPVFTCWRPTDWGVGERRKREQKSGNEASIEKVLSAGAHDAKGGSNPTASPSSSSSSSSSCVSGSDSDEALLSGGPKAGELFLERQRREVFPSMVPQLLLHGYFRNDLLMKVNRRRRVRRVRNADTGVVVHVEELPDSGTEDGVHSEVVGVVSRDLQLARPADFSFSLFSKEMVASMPGCCSADLFPPMHFLGTKSTYQVPYSMGAEVNTSVREHQRRVQQQGPPGSAGMDPALLGSVKNELDEDADQEAREEGRVRGVTAGLSVETDDPNIPPAPTLAQRSYLAYMGCSPTHVAAIMSGDLASLFTESRPEGHDATPRAAEAEVGVAEEDNDELGACPVVEVRVLSRLLASRPVWLTADLKRAMTNSGVCPRAFTNKEVIMCMTYCFRKGPFNRLRIRMGYNPYASSLHSAIYQRLSVRLFRRSGIGVQVRDLARSPHIKEAVRIILRKHAAAIVEASKRIEAERAGLATEARTPGCFGTLLETLCSVVVGGTLSVACQLADLQDDDVYHELLTHVTPATDMPLSSRRNREGWLTPAAFQRALTHFTEAMTTFLHDQVVPTVRSLSGATLPTAVEDDREDDEEREEEEGSSRSESGSESEADRSSSISAAVVSSSEASGDDDDDDVDDDDDDDDVDDADA